MNKYKKILEKKEQYIQFSEEELKELGWKQNQKISIELKDGGIQLTPWVSIDIDMSDWSKDILLFLIEKSCELDISVNEVLTQIIEESLKQKSEFYEL